MEQKNAWIYCRIDAPEDTHGALKGQYEQLQRYAEQMGFAVVGSSQDLGTELNMKSTGITALMEAASTGAFSVLLVTSLAALGRGSGEREVILYALSWYGIAIYSPLEGSVGGVRGGLL